MEIDLLREFLDHTQPVLLTIEMEELVAIWAEPEPEQFGDERRLQVQYLEQGISGRKVLLDDILHTRTAGLQYGGQLQYSSNKFVFSSIPKFAQIKEKLLMAVIFP